MLVNIEKVKALSPCKERFNNFVAGNPNFAGDHEKFLTLENITYSDKVWVMVRLMSQKQNALWAASCAESVLHLIREKDREVCRSAIEAVRKFFKGEITRDELLATRRTVYAYAAYAAYAADAAAAYAAAAYAAYAAAAADAADAAYAAAAAAADAAAAAADAYAAAAAADAAAYAAAAAAAAAAADAAARSLQQQKCLNLMVEVLNQTNEEI